MVPGQCSADSSTERDQIGAELESLRSGAVRTRAWQSEPLEGCKVACQCSKGKALNLVGDQFLEVGNGI